jgi:hypothetical protein
MFFGLHPKPGEHGAAAHNKADSAGRPAAPMGFPMRFDEAVSECKSLVIWGTLPNPERRYGHRRAAQPEAQKGGNLAISPEPDHPCFSLKNADLM